MNRKPCSPADQRERSGLGALPGSVGACVAASEAGMTSQGFACGGPIHGERLAKLQWSLARYRTRFRNG